MGREHEPDLVWQAQELYCADRLTYQAIADRLGIGMATVSRWSEKFGWRAKREELAQAEADIRADTVLARAAMLKTLLEKKDAMSAFAVSSLEGLALKQAEMIRSGKIGPAPAPAEHQPIRTPDEAAEALGRAVTAKLHRLLADPDAVNLRSVEEIRKALALVAEMKAAVNKETDSGSKAGISRDLESAILKVLGGEL